jgi:putative membrane protein
MARERTGMASFRTKLAMDRTTLAWIRSALTMATFGFGLVGFFRALRAQHATAEAIRMHEGAIHFGIGLIVLAIGAMGATALSHWFTLRRLRRGEPLDLTKWPLAIVLALLLALVFLAGLAAILVESGG